MKSDELSKLAQDLVELRGKKGVGQEELAEALGVTQKSISDWETGKVVPGAQNLGKLSTYFGKKITDEGIKGSKVSDGVILQIQKEVLETIIQHTRTGFEKNEATLQKMVAELKSDKDRSLNEKDVEISERIKLQNDNRRLIELLSSYMKPPDNRK